VVEVSENKYDAEHNVCMAVIKGSAFLWHQVRCMMSVLFMIGKGIEDISVIDKLLDVNLITERPNYEIADGNNLILSDCGFEGIEWKNANLYSDIETYKVAKS
jgi:tRNA pseudouridine38/39 synthase